MSAVSVSPARAGRKFNVSARVSAVLAVASVAAVSSMASAALTTYTYTVPVGGFPLTFGATPPSILDSFTATPKAKVVGLTWTDLSLTTFVDTWGSDIRVGFAGRADGTETVISARPFFSSNTTGSFGPITTSFDLTLPPDFYVSETGVLPFVAFSSYDNGSGSEGTLDGGTITVTVDDSIIEPLPTTPTATQLGVLSPGDSFSVTGTVAAGEVTWLSFSLLTPVGAGELFEYLDIVTNGSDFDTEIGLYDASGALISNDDDSGFGLTSALSFGIGSGQLIGDFGTTDNFGDGFDGDLAAGTYYLAIGGFNTTFGGGGFAVTPGGDFGNFTATFIGAAIPEPSSLGLLAPAGLLLARRRR